MKLRVLRAVALVALVFVALASPVSAQDFDLGDEAPALSIQGFEPIAGPHGIFSVEGSEVGHTFNISAGFILNYASDPLVLIPDEGDEVSVVSQQLVGDVLFAIAFNRRVEVGVGLPVYLVNDAMLNQNALDGATLGDIRLRPKFAILNAEEHGFGIALIAQIGLPTGDAARFTSGGGVTFRPGVIADVKVGKVLLASNLSLDLQEEQTFAGLEVGSGLRYAAGLQYDVYNEQIFVGGELFGRSAFTDFLSETTTAPMEGLLGLKTRSDFGIQAEFGVGTGIIPGYGAPNYRIIGGLRYVDVDGDRDRDGIPDKKDTCPDEPEDRDGFEDAEGCPDPDNDQDTVLDIEDDCPNDAEDADGFEDADGCPDPDNDQDTVLDINDHCLNEPGTPENNGCPDADIDKDGILNVDDQCPNDPEDKDGYEDGDGCPDPDNDADGILDTVDACPEQPEDIDQFEDTDGCPDPDNDKDGILDVADDCPNKKGPKKWQGCPGKRRAVIIGNEIRILEKVYFKTGKSAIQKRSFKLLDEVASILRDVPGITKIEIQGHTDDVGGEASNQRLSDGRATAVRAYIVGKGIAADRLDAKGYGETTPAVATDGLRGRTLKRARADNRRVQFKITGRARKIIEVAPDAPSGKMKRDN